MGAEPCIVYIGPVPHAFADDKVLVTELEEDLQHNIRALQTAVKEHKLAVNWTKGNKMAIGREITGCKVEVEGQNVKNVSEVVYLGVKFSEEGRMEGELERRIGIAMNSSQGNESRSI